MTENVQVAVFILLLAGAAAIYIYHTHQVNLANRPIYVTQNFVSLNYSPSTTNIDSVKGNGHTIGNENKVQNEVA